jgi:apolipoprotein D and lipocalin family protein
VILELDQQDYSYSLVCGPDKSYLWILARSPFLDKDVRDRLISRASSLGFDTGKLIFVNHDERDKP